MKEGNSMVTGLPIHRWVTIISKNSLKSRRLKMSDFTVPIFEGNTLNQFNNSTSILHRNDVYLYTEKSGINNTKWMF